MKKIILIILLLLITVVIALPMYYDTEKEVLTSEIRAKISGDFISLSQGITHYQQANVGADRVVVLVHGFSVPYYIWDPTYNFLVAQGFHVIRFDAYGRGFSDRPDVDYDQALFDTQIMDLLAGLKITKKVDIMGLSMGGAVVAKFVADHPEKVNKVVFIDPSHQSFYNWKIGAPLLGEFLFGVFKMPKAALGQLTDFFQPEKFVGWDKKYEVQMQYKGHRNALLSTLRHFAKPDKLYLYQAVGELAIPKLLIWGKQDNTLPISKSPRVAKALKVETFVVENSGHLPHYEHPELINAKLLEFLNL